MLYPSIFSENLFDDLMDFSFPTFRDFNFDDVDRKLYGKHAARLMKTDVHEHDDLYEIDIDLPGFKKEDITLTLEKGNLTVAATKGLDKDEKNKKGRVIRQERYSGSMQRSFFVGHNVTEEEEDHCNRGLMQSNQFLSRSPVLCILSNIPTDDRLGGRRNLGKQ